MDHKAIGAGEMHVLENWTYADAASRTGASGFVAADVGKIAYQTDTGVYYRLTATTPTWAVPGVAAGSVTLAMMANMATTSLLGRNTAGAGVPEVLSVATVKTLLNLTGTNSGDQTITLTGDVTGTGTGSFAATIANSAVTLAKMADIGTLTLIGRQQLGTGVPQALSNIQARQVLGLDAANTPTFAGIIISNGSWFWQASNFGIGGNWAGFSAESTPSLGGYALLSDANTGTYLNNKTGGEVGLRINNTTYFKTTSILATLSVALTTSSVYKVGANQVVGARDTGWTAMTGANDKATAYAVASVTLAQLAGRVMQLQASLTTHGLIGA